MDTNVILDILENEALGLAINPMIYAELCPSSQDQRELDSRLSPLGFKYLEMPRKGLFFASIAFQTYRKNKGACDSLLPDFLIGGHAESASLTILTRDPRRYRNYFPSVPLIFPK